MLRHKLSCQHFGQATSGKLLLYEQTKESAYIAYCSRQCALQRQILIEFWRWQVAYGDILAAEETVLLASTYLVGDNAGPGAYGACLEVRAATLQGLGWEL